jgi:hypothetical protein
MSKAIVIFFYLRQAPRQYMRAGGDAGSWSEANAESKTEECELFITT